MFNINKFNCSCCAEEKFEIEFPADLISGMDNGKTTIELDYDGLLTLRMFIHDELLRENPGATLQWHQRQVLAHNQTKEAVAKGFGND